LWKKSGFSLTRTKLIVELERKKNDVLSCEVISEAKPQEIDILLSKIAEQVESPGMEV
jgi:hypothetical protein